MFYLASSVTMPLPLAALLLILCVGEAIYIFYRLGAKNTPNKIEETPATRTNADADFDTAAPDEEDLAVILSVMCEELNARPEELEFKDIRLVS